MTTILDPTRRDERAPTTRHDRRLLAAGALAGPLFVVVSAVQGALRDGFSFADHPPSALSNGDLGWIQMANFVVTGALVVGAGVALRRTVNGRGSVWGPRLLTVFGVALVAAGIFPMDAGFGFPPGTPTGAPDATSWHGALHGLAFFVGFGALVAACFVFASRYRALGRPAWRWCSFVAGPTSLVLSAVPNAGDPDGRFLSLWLAVTVAFAWTAAVLTDTTSRQGADR
jgi:hypothetical protein